LSADWNAPDYSEQRPLPRVMTAAISDIEKIARFCRIVMQEHSARLPAYCACRKAVAYPFQVLPNN